MFICLPRGRRRGLARSRLLVLLVRLGWVRSCRHRAMGKSFGVLPCDGDVGAGWGGVVGVVFGGFEVGYAGVVFEDAAGF